MQGLIFIPDISGFTNFVKNIDIDLGVSITSDLLNGIIDNNPLDLDISEIEGDAVLFYKIGKPISLHLIIDGFEKMFEAFNSKYREWKQLHNIEAELSLKLIVHYGNINVYNIKGFKKLYGETVIDSHRLLKNDIDASDYILVTEDYIQALEHHNYDTSIKDNCHRYKRSEIFNCIKRIPYYFFSGTNTSYVQREPVQDSWLPNNLYQAASMCN